jgi:hypothetical protein
MTSFPDNPFLYKPLESLKSTAPTSNSLQLAADYRLEWKVNNTATGLLEFTLCGNFSGWMGIGFNAKSATMDQADVIIAKKESNGNWSVNDYFTQSHVTPILDTQLGGTNSVVLIADATADCYSRQGVKFQRLAVTGDTFDTNVDSSVNIIFAHSADGSNNLDYHSLSNRGATSANLLSATCSSIQPATVSTGVQIYHGIVMLIGIGVLFPTGVFFIRYLSIYSAYAVLYHRYIMMFAT